MSVARVGRGLGLEHGTRGGGRKAGAGDRILLSSRGRFLLTAVLLFVGALHGSLAAAEQVTVRVVTSGESVDRSPKGDVTIRLRPLGGEAGLDELPETLEAVLRFGQSLDLELDGSLVWRVQAEAEGLWSPEKVVGPFGGKASVVLELFPAGRVRVPIEVARMSQPPGRLEVRFQPTPAEGRLGEQPRGSIECPVAQGLAQCSLPAALLDLRISAPSWVPAYRFGTLVRAGKELSLDPVFMMRGASVSGVVLLDSGGPAPRGTEVTLDLPGRDAGAVQPKLDLLVYRSKTNERGFFQFSGVQPGRYDILAVADGYAPARVDSIWAEPDLESKLVDPVILSRPVAFELQVVPAHDPWGEAWTVSLSQLDANGESLTTVVEPLSAEGTVKRDDLAPGRYRLTVVGSEETRWLTREIELFAGQGTLVEEIPLIGVEGRLTKGGEPAPGRLWFGTSDGVRRIVFDVGEEGELSGYLPEAGSWPLEWIPASANGVQVALDPVEVPDKSRVFLALEVPDTKLEGETVDERGSAVAAARVRIHSADPDIRTSFLESDEEGHFSIEGLEPGRYLAQAQRGDATSEIVSTDVLEDLEAPELHLVLRDKVELGGHIQSRGRAVAGARVTAWPDLASSPGVSFLQAVSDPDGIFVVEAPGLPTELNLLVRAPGYGISMGRAAVAPGQLAEIELDPDPGTLILTGSVPKGMSVFLVHDGSYLPVLALLRLAAIDSPQVLGAEGLVIAGLEPGRYLVCAGEQALSELRSGVVEPSAGCHAGVVPPYGELRLELPDGKLPDRVGGTR